MSVSFATSRNERDMSHCYARCLFKKKEPTLNSRILQLNSLNERSINGYSSPFPLGLGRISFGASLGRTERHDQHRDRTMCFAAVENFAVSGCYLPCTIRTILLLEKTQQTMLSHPCSSEEIDKHLEDMNRIDTEFFLNCIPMKNG
jgi:hypothetical protein